jgi:D-lyxose ketol-isomerase
MGKERMLRSEINGIIERGKALLTRHQFRLPLFAHWPAKAWAEKGVECDEIRDCKLGWDVTDFGSGAFDQTGLLVFTIRNGHPTLEPYRQTVYCEKILIVGEDQHTPMHHHLRKQEDIICRAGGNLVCQVFNRDSDGGLCDSDVTVSLDGVKQIAPAGHRFVLKPGESIRLTPFVYHEFYAEIGGGPSIVGEVSTVNDDANDNIFLNAPARFPAIIEDEAPVHLLCTEYPKGDGED